VGDEVGGVGEHDVDPGTDLCARGPGAGEQPQQ